MEKVAVVDGDGCWLWTGATDPKTGYGRFGVRDERTGKHHVVNAQRQAWELVNGPIPNGLQGLHRCDVRACVKATDDPATSHIFLGTPADNIADCYAKSRYHLRKLTLSDAEKMRAEWDAGLYPSMAAAGRAYGVTRRWARLIIQRRCWAIAA